MRGRASLQVLADGAKTKEVSFGEVVEVESEQPKIPVKKERKSFFDARPAASSVAAAPAPVSIFDTNNTEDYKVYRDELVVHDSKRARTA